VPTYNDFNHGRRQPVIIFEEKLSRMRHLKADLEMSAATYKFLSVLSQQVSLLLLTSIFSDPTSELKLPV
jgi:hypothetical protein